MYISHDFIKGLWHQLLSRWLQFHGNHCCMKNKSQSNCMWRSDFISDFREWQSLQKVSMAFVLQGFPCLGTSASGLPSQGNTCICWWLVTRFRSQRPSLLPGFISSLLNMILKLATLAVAHKSTDLTPVNMELYTSTTLMNRLGIQALARLSQGEGILIWGKIMGKQGLEGG